MGIADYTSRLAADVLKTTYLREASVSESVLYARVVWGLVGAGCAILLAGVSQPLVLLVLSACVGGTMMAVYSVLLLWLNRRCLPPPLRAGRARMATLAWSALFFGVLAAFTIRQQLGLLLAR